MRRFTTRVAVACGCALAAAAFSGAAVAGNGHGNESAPGQQKQEQAASTQPAPAEQAPEQQAATGQPAQQQAQQQQRVDHSSPGRETKQEKKQAKAAASATAEAGVKPSNTTTHWTHCTTGGAGTGGATCTAQAGTPDVSADVSKRYGNGETAAQIAVGRGAPDGTLVTGPGNSQPHKVSACGKKSNRSGGVDVHAIKSYDASACVPAAPQPVTPVQHEETPVQQTEVASVNATMTSTPSTPAPTSTVSVTQGSSPATQSAGGVLGTSKTIAKPKPAPAGGVLGKVSNVAGQTLPFTGFPIWAAMLVALGLIASGLVLRRRVAVTAV